MLVQAKARSVFGGRFVQLVIGNEDVDNSMLDVRYGLGRHMPMLAGGLPEPLFIVGPYGAACGKAELIQRLMRDCPDVFAQPVPCTTRRGNRKAMTDGPFQVSTARSLWVSSTQSSCGCAACMLAVTRAFWDDAPIAVCHDWLPALGSGNVNNTSPQGHTHCE